MKIVILHFGVYKEISLLRWYLLHHNFTLHQTLHFVHLMRHRITSALPAADPLN